MGDWSLPDGQPFIDWLQSTVLSGDNGSGPGHSDNGSRPAPTMQDGEIVALARAAKNGASFSRLYDAGDIGDYASHSEADAALCAKLAFYSRDAAQLDRLFRSSALMRPKWDELRGAATYGQITIGRALEFVTESYQPGSGHGGRPAGMSRDIPEEPAGFWDGVEGLSSEGVGLSSPAAAGGADGAKQGPEVVEKVAYTFADAARVVGKQEWLWPGWLPRGELAMLASASGLGKSYLALSLAAAITSGKAWPDGSHGPAGGAKVVWAEAEAAHALNINRARAMKLPLDRVLMAPLVNPQAPDIYADFSLDKHFDDLWLLITRSDVQLVIIDALRGAIGGDENSSAIEKPLRELAGLCQRTGKAMLINHHLRKMTPFDGKRVTLDMVRGSSALVQYARVVWAIDAPDDEQRAKRRLYVIKNNLAAFPGEVGFEVLTDGVVEFGEAPADGQQRRESERAVEWLCEYLADGPKPSAEAALAAAAIGISSRTLRRARESVAKAVKVGAAWHWELTE